MTTNESGAFAAVVVVEGGLVDGSPGDEQPVATNAAASARTHARPPLARPRGVCEGSLLPPNRSAMSEEAPLVAPW
ncbi:MAG TPA: hypothetical protein VES02_02395 [Dermatophilaceae bacterium]|nr:hypothetical protein [Dermatophilaceae bacterium]